jgi:uncharacterized membrane protein
LRWTGPPSGIVGAGTAHARRNPPGDRNVTHDSRSEPEPARGPPGPPVHPDDPAGEVPGSSLEERVARLERVVNELARRSVEAGAIRTVPPDATAVVRPIAVPHPPPVDPGAPTGTLDAYAAPASAPVAAGRSASDWLRRGEDWVGRVGVVLLVLGLTFLYRYAVDRGWITPWLRVAFGLNLGVALIVLGLYWRRIRPAYSQVLLGGGLAVLYLTGWAARMLFALVPWAAGFAFMAAVTGLALLLAGRREHQLLALIGAIGGLLSPFLLGPGSESVSGLVAYTALVLAWAGWLQLRHGWGLLLVVNLVGGFQVMAFAVGQAQGTERWSVVAGTLLVWLVACGVPYLQAWLHAHTPPAGPAPPRLPIDPLLPGHDSSRAARRVTLWLLGVGVSGLTVLIMEALWDLGRVPVGFAFLAFAVPFFLTSRWLAGSREVATPAFLVGAVLLALGTAVSAGWLWQPVPLAVEAAAFLWLARDPDRRSLTVLAHVVFAILAFYFLGRVQEAFLPGPMPPAGYQLGILAAMAIAAYAAVRFIPDLPAARVYLFGSYAAFLAWVLWVLHPLPDGQGLGSVVWGVVALLLLAVGVRSGRLGIRMTGLATLGLLTLKLVLVDLAVLDPGLRILLFLAFGSVFLALGSVLRGSDAAAMGKHAP